MEVVKIKNISEIKKQKINWMAQQKNRDDRVSKE